MFASFESRSYGVNVVRVRQWDGMSAEGCIVRQGDMPTCKNSVVSVVLALGISVVRLQ